MKRNTEIKQQLAQPEYKGCTYSINVHIKKENEVKHTSKDFPHWKWCVREDEEINRPHSLRLCW